MELYGRLRSFLRKLKGTAKKKRPESSPPSPSFNWATSSFAAAEMKSQLQQVFDLIDANGDGKISPTEFGLVLLRLGQNKSSVAKDAEGMVREADHNGDGFVDLEEFMHAVCGKTEEMDRDLMEAFLVFDTDRDGFISAKELHRVMSGLEIGRFSLKECKLMIKRVDKNGDGLVDFEEFRSLMTSGRNFSTGSCLINREISFDNR